MASRIYSVADEEVIVLVEGLSLALVGDDLNQAINIIFDLYEHLELELGGFAPISMPALPVFLINYDPSRRKDDLMEVWHG